MASSDLPRLRARHIDDCLRAAQLVTAAPPGPCADVGSGAGFPGVVLALAAPGRTWRLLEPRTRRAAFLEEVVRDLGLDCEVLRVTAQEAAADPALRGAHAVVTGRALAPPGVAFELLRPLVAPGGVTVVWIGRHAKLPPEAEEWAEGLAIMRSAATS